ncbi:hypothetical protein D3C76_143320 [compost metagenome]
MIEYSVQHHPDTFGMSVFHQPLQHLNISETGIHLPVIGGVIFMIARRFEDGRQIYSRNSKLSQIIQVIDDSLQIPSKKAFPCGGISPCPYIHRIISGIAIGKTVRKDLIKHCRFSPFRGFEQVNFMDIGSLIESIRWIWLPGQEAGFQHPEGFFPRLKAECIGKTLVFRLYCRFPIIKELVSGHLLHAVFFMIMFPIIFVARECEDLIHIPLAGPDAQMEGLLVIKIRPVAVGDVMEAFKMNT